MPLHDPRPGGVTRKPLPAHEDFELTELFEEAEAAQTPGNVLKKRGRKPAMASTSAGLASLKIDRSGTPTRKRRRWPWWAAGCMLAVAAVLGAWRVVPLTPQVQVAAVVITTPSQQYVQLTASGYVVAQIRAAVASKAAGRLVELHVREGSVVRKNQLLARLDASDVRAAIASAQATVSQAEALVRLAEVELASAMAEVTRTENLAQTGFVSPQAVENARARVNSARANVAAAKASVNQTLAQLTAQKVNQDFTEIRAPFDGVVLIKNANVGDMITPMSSAAGAQGAVVTMADMSTLEVEADVSEGNLSKARAGQPVEVTLDALPDMRFKGRVAGVVPTVDRSKATIMTKIRFDKLDPRVLPEMTAKVAFLSRDITDTDQKPVLAVNRSTVTQRPDGQVVFKTRVDTGSGLVVDMVPVRVGRKLGELVELTALSGALNAGDKLVLLPDDGLRAGARVRLINH